MAQIEPLEVTCKGEEWCPVTCTASVLGRKWHPVIVDRLLGEGPLGFSALETAVDGVSSKVLSESLDDLEAKGLVDRSVVDDHPIRVTYSLTDRGESLEPVVRAMRQWGAQHLVAPSQTSPVDGPS